MPAAGAPWSQGGDGLQAICLPGAVMRNPSRQFAPAPAVLRAGPCAFAAMEVSC